MPKNEFFLEKEHLSARAADDLVGVFAEKISRGDLQDGDTLPAEREIQETYGVSRTVAREAIQTLANKGLIEARPRHRPVVRQPTFETAIATIGSVVDQLLLQPNGVRNLFETRIMVETSLVRQAATGATKDDIVAMRAALTANEAAVNDSHSFYETDQAFHATLYETARNPILTAIHKGYSTWLAPHWQRMEQLPDRNAKNYAAHSAIFDAILVRDPDLAERHLRDHLNQAWDQVRHTFDAG